MHPVERYARCSGIAYDADVARVRAALSAIGLTLIQHIGVAFAARDADTLIIVSRGTDDVADIVTDIEVATEIFKPSRSQGMGFRVHGGALERWMDIRTWANTVSQMNTRWPRQIVLCGHSLGAMDVTLGAMDLWSIVPIAVYTYGSPRVGLADFADAYNAMVPATTRVVHDHDAITTVPSLIDIPYTHVKTLLHLSDDGSVIGSGTGWLHALLGWITFKAERDHHVSDYIAACTAYAAKEMACSAF